MVAQYTFDIVQGSEFSVQILMSPEEDQHVNDTWLWYADLRKLLFALEGDRCFHTCYKH